MKIILSTLALLSIILGAFSYRIPLPPGKTAESVIHIGGSNYLQSDVITGNVLLTDISTRQTFTVIQAPANRSIQGLAYDKSRGLVLAAGSGAPYTTVLNNQISATKNVLNIKFPLNEPAIHIYTLTTGEEYTTCTVPGSILINDVEIDPKREFAYFSETRAPFLYRLSLKNLPACVIEKIPLPKEAFSGPAFYAAGIAYYKGGLFIASFTPEQIYYYDLKSKRIYKVVDTGFGGMDGLRMLENRCLLGASNDANVVNVFRVYKNRRNSTVKVKFARTIKNKDFTELTAMAINGRTLVATNNDMEVLGETGKLWTTVVRIPSVYKLC